MHDVEGATTHRTEDELDIGAFSDDDRPELVHQALLENEILGFQRCRECSASIFPPRVMCQACGGMDYGWERSSGTGEVYSVTVVSPRESAPYCVALVDVDGGPRLMTNIVTDEPDDVAIGARVTVGFIVAGDSKIPVFSTGEATDADR